METVETAVSY